MKQKMFIDRHMLPTRDLQKAFNAWVKLLCRVFLDDYHLKWLM